MSNFVRLLVLRRIGTPASLRRILTGPSTTPSPRRSFSDAIRLPPEGTEEDPHRVSLDPKEGAGAPPEARSSLSNQPARSKLFTVEGLVRNYSVFPLLFIVGFALSVMCAVPAHFLLRAPDLELRVRPKISDTMDLERPPNVHLYDPYGFDRAMPELKRLLEDVEEGERLLRAKQEADNK